MTCGAISGFPGTQRLGTGGLRCPPRVGGASAKPLTSGVSKDAQSAWLGAVWSSKKPPKTLSISFHFFHFLSANRALSTGCTDCRATKKKLLFSSTPFRRDRKAKAAGPPRLTERIPSSLERVPNRSERNPRRMERNQNFPEQNQSPLSPAKQGISTGYRLRSSFPRPNAASEPDRGLRQASPTAPAAVRALPMSLSMGCIITPTLLLWKQMFM